ncbi:MAG: YkoF family thiamine/hydroxymethylpyrimidine-binding protein [Steroidobacteraceae bacterium]
MQIGVEISLYPLRGEYIPPIKDFIDRLNAAGEFRVQTNTMSTQVFGEYDRILAVLQREMRSSFEKDGKCIFVMKVLGPLAD